MPCAAPGRESSACVGDLETNYEWFARAVLAYKGLGPMGTTRECQKARHMSCSGTFDEHSLPPTPPSRPPANTRACKPRVAAILPVPNPNITIHSELSFPFIIRGCVTGASAALARATLPTFERLRARLQIAQQGDASQESARAVAASRLFAAAVSVALDTHLNDANEKAAHSPNDESASASTHAGYLAAAKATWQLCGAVFVEPGDGSGFVSQSLVEWFKENAGACGLGQNGLPERLRATLFEIGEISDESNAFRNGHDGDDDEDGQADADARKRHPEDAAGYWECFASLVAVGWVDAAVDLVGLHSCWDQWRVGVHSAKPHAELLEAVVALLRCVPRMASVSDETIAEEEQFGDGLGDGDDADWRIFGGQNSKRGRDRESQKNAKEETTNSNGFTAVSAPQFAAFREAWIRQVQRVLDDVALFDQCPDSRVATGCRAALSAMAGEETAVSRAVPHNAGWMELFIAETRCRFTSLRVAGDCAALVRRCVASRGVSQNTPEMVRNFPTEHVPPSRLPIRDVNRFLFYISGRASDSRFRSGRAIRHRGGV